MGESPAFAPFLPCRPPIANKLMLSSPNGKVSKATNAPTTKPSLATYASPLVWKARPPRAVSPAIPTASTKTSNFSPATRPNPPALPTLRCSSADHPGRYHSCQRIRRAAEVANETQRTNRYHPRFAAHHTGRLDCQTNRCPFKRSHHPEEAGRHYRKSGTPGTPGMV